VIDVLWSRPVYLKNIVQHIVWNQGGSASVVADLNGQINVPGEKSIVSIPGYRIDFRPGESRNAFETLWVLLGAP
jgi:hypothetical protein